MTNHDTLVEAAKAAPPLGVAGFTMFGLPVSDVVLLLTGLYTCFLLIEKFPTIIQRFTSLAAWLKEKRR